MDKEVTDDEVMDEETYHQDPAIETADRDAADDASAGIDPDEVKDAPACPAKGHRLTKRQAAIVLGVYVVAAVAAVAARYWMTKMAVRSAIRDELRR